MKAHVFLVVLIVSLSVIVPCMAADFSPEVTGDSVHYNITRHFDEGTTTPQTIWLLAAILGVGLFLWTIISAPKSTSDLERDAVMSVIAWVPIGFTAITSFAVEEVTSAGTAVTADSGIVLLENHVIHDYSLIGILFGILLLIAIINTIRILTLHKSLRLEQEKPQVWRGN